MPDPNNCENLWACYAWPISAARTGQRTFFVNQDGEILQYANQDSDYDGLAAGGPNFDAAFTNPGDMSSQIATSGPGNDTNIWRPIN